MKGKSAQEASFLLGNFTKTYVCVALAGLIFVWAVLDWLPLPIGWMKFGERPPKKSLLMLHVALTLAAYDFFVLWLLGFSASATKFLFLEMWWLAVMSGVFTTVNQLRAA